MTTVVLCQLFALPPLGLVGVDGAVLEPPKAPITCFLTPLCFFVIVAVENVVVVEVVVGFTLRVSMLLLYVPDAAVDIGMLAESGIFWKIGATHSCLGRASWSKREALTVRLPGVLVVPVRMYPLPRREPLPLCITVGRRSVRRRCAVGRTDAWMDCARWWVEEVGVVVSSPETQNIYSTFGFIFDGYKKMER